MTIKFFAYIRDYTHVKEMEFEECDTVRTLLQKLCDKYGEKFRAKVFEKDQLSSEIIILINGRHITHFNGIESKLDKDDEISIFPVVAGG